MSSSSMSSSKSTTYTSSSSTFAPVVEKVLLPTQVIEKPVAIHEEIRKELIEEVQPVVNVEKFHTEVHQVTQPLFDKEVRAVQIENRTLATEILPEVRVEGRGFRQESELSTTRFLDTAKIVVEKPALVTEIEKMQIIEEIQPVIYKETIVPTVIQETKPIYQKVVEGTVFTQETLAAKEVANRSVIHEAYVPSNVVVAPVRESVMLPTQFVEKPTAVHEEIRRETIEEITPVVNVEKIKTEVHQITAPLFDKEIKPVLYEKKTLATEILPEVMIEGRGVRAVEDYSTTRYLDTKTTFVEKAAIINEVERTQIIEEIQPVVYKETIVPTVIRETKPVYQKIVEGTVYTHQTLAPRSLHETNFHYPTNQAPIEFPENIPVVVREVAQPVREVIVETVAAPVVVAPVQHGVKEIIEETVTTTTTTTAAPIVAAPQRHGLFHRHSAETNTTGSTFAHTSTGSSSTLVDSSRVLPGETKHFHNERVGPNGQKIIEDSTVSHSHTEQVLPTRLI